MPKFLTDSLATPHPRPEEGREIEQAMDKELGALGDATHLPQNIGKIAISPEHAEADAIATAKSEAAWEQIQGK